MVREKGTSLKITTTGYIRLFLYLPVCIMAWIERNSPTDLDIYLQASRDYVAGINPFNELYHQWYHYYYSQFFALLMFPLALMPKALGHMCWMLLNYFLAEQCFFLIEKQTGNIPAPHKATFRCILIAASMRFVYENLHYGQVSILILWFCLKAWDAIENKKLVAAGSWLAIGINLKILPLALLPWLVLRKKGKTLISCMLVFFLLATAPALFTGMDSCLEMGRSRWALINPIQSQHIKDVAEDSFHSITTFLSVFLSDNEPYKGMRRSILQLDDTALAQGIFAARALFALSMLIYMYRQGGISGSQKRHVYEWYFALVLIPLVFPHQQHYAFIFIIPAFALQVAAFFSLSPARRNKLKVKGFLLFVPAVIWSLKLLLGEFNPFYEYYKILTWSALWLWLLVFYEGLFPDHSPRPTKIE